MEWPPGTDAEWKKQNQENIVYRDSYTVVKSNLLVFTSSCNAKTQNNAEGLMKKKVIHIQRNNCEIRNTEEKQLLELMCW